RRLALRISILPATPHLKSVYGRGEPAGRNAGTNRAALVGLQGGRTELGGAMRTTTTLGTEKMLPGIALLVGATLLSSVESQAQMGGGASARKLCPNVVNQTCATVADCGGAVDPTTGAGGVSCDAVTHHCTVQCATTFANTDPDHGLTQI